MLRLDLTNEPRWIALALGVRVLHRPVTSAILSAARADVAVSGLAPDASPDIAALAAAGAVARLVVIGWEGVGDADGRPAPVTPEGIDALLQVWPVYEAFQMRVIGPVFALEREKNDCAPSPNGTSAAARPTARPARTSAGKSARRVQAS